MIKGGYGTRILAALLLAVLIAISAQAETVSQQAEAFADWFVAQQFEGHDYYIWKSVFDALTDGIDRSREAKMKIETPVYVAILTGTKYHTTESCSAFKNATRVLEMDEAEAAERGFKECTKCN